MLRWPASGLHAVYGIETIEHAANAAAINRVFLDAGTSSSRYFFYSSAIFYVS